jgi:hypothetical protein
MLLDIFRTIKFSPLLVRPKTPASPAGVFSFRKAAACGDARTQVVAKVEWHPGELYPRVGFIVTNLARPAERVVAFYNHRGTCEQYIKEGKGAIKWTRLSVPLLRCQRRPPLLRLLILRPVTPGRSMPTTSWPARWCGRPASGIWPI